MFVRYGLLHIIDDLRINFRICFSERVMLDGMRNLQQLSLRNNSLSILENSTFTSIPQITTLDLAHNGIRTIEKNVFTPLKDIFWLDLSFNFIKTIEKNTFKERIANILLNGMFPNSNRIM